jgi:hypothetical protein
MVPLTPCPLNTTVQISARACWQAADTAIIDVAAKSTLRIFKRPPLCATCTQGCCLGISASYPSWSAHVLRAAPCSVPAIRDSRDCGSGKIMVARMSPSLVEEATMAGHCEPLVQYYDIVALG